MRAPDFRFPLLLSCAAASLAAAQPTVYWGFDANAGPSSPRPVSLAAEAAWQAAVTGATGGPVCITFDGVALSTVITNAGAPIGNGVTLYAAHPLRPITILDPASQGVANGFNTTNPAGSGHRASLVGAYLSGSNLYYDITFSSPIEAFAMWVTGEGHTVSGGQMSLTYTGSSASWLIPMSGSMGAQFIGFVDPGESITQVTLMLPMNSSSNAQPFISIDDICWKKSCPADFNGDWFVNGDDFDAFVAGFEAGDADADFNGDLFVSGDDFDSYVVAFETGC